MSKRRRVGITAYKVHVGLVYILIVIFFWGGGGLRQNNISYTRIQSIDNDHADQMVMTVIFLKILCIQWSRQFTGSLVLIMYWVNWKSQKLYKYIDRTSVYAYHVVSNVFCMSTNMIHVIYNIRLYTPSHNVRGPGTTATSGLTTPDITRMNIPNLR